MTDQHRSQWPDASPADPQLSVVQPATSPGCSGQSVNLVSPPPADYAGWGQRLRARLIDQGPTYLGLIIFFAGYVVWVVELAQSSGSAPDFESPAIAMIIGLSVMLASMIWVAYNRWMIGGSTGQSFGKRVIKIKLIGEASNAPIGPRNACIRDLVHILDALTVVGYLWPLWDDKRQTFADKIMNSIVVNDASNRPGS
jgi:uncharacterized RDD family membrane protein YckC